MTKKHLILMIGEILEKYQFSGHGSIWSRDYTDFIDVIDLQISQSKDTFTINVGVADKFVMDLCWGNAVSDPVQEQFCTVRGRLGELLHGRDVWWKLSDNIDFEEIFGNLERAAIPFLQRNHSIDCMIESLESDPAGRRYPPGVIYLALLYHRKGESGRCREILQSGKLIGAWHKKAFDILEKLN